MGLGERGRRGNWRNQRGMATTRYGGPTTVRPIVEEDTSQALIEDLINKYIFKTIRFVIWYCNLYYSIEIFSSICYGIEIFYPRINY